MEREGISRLLLRVNGLAVLRGVLASSVARDFLEVLDLLATEEPDPVAVAGTFGRLWEGLALDQERLLPDSWRSHLVGRLLDDENAFSLGAERGELSPPLAEQASRDLRTLEGLFDLEAEPLLRMVESAVPGLEGTWFPWGDPGGGEGESPRHAVARKLAAAEDWGGCVGLLADHFARHGAGPFGRHRAFRWTDGRPQAVLDPDPVSLADLVAYEREREPLVRNTERFLAGLPAHHTLLYGQPGTGKSSTVKAVMNEYADGGLRLVGGGKEDVGG